MHPHKTLCVTYSKHRRSEHLINGVLCLQGPDAYAWDLCDNGQCPTVYGRSLPMAERRLRHGERCVNCGNLRYSKRNNQLQPARRFVHLRCHVMYAPCMHLFMCTFARLQCLYSQARRRSETHVWSRDVCTIRGHAHTSHVGLSGVQAS